MNRTTNLFAGFLLAMTPWAFAQQPQPQFPEDALATRQLVAWTRFQKPQPAPQPLPPRDTPGKIVKDGNRYVLQVASNTSYELQNPEDVKQYENQTVKVIGSLDTGTNTIRVVKIELLS